MSKSTPPETVAFDRGPTPYFHGRERIQSDFRSHIEQAEGIKAGGTTFLIQGAPGSGKTALLYELGKIAEAQDWKVVKIKTSALWDKGKMLRALNLGKWPGIESIRISSPEGVETEVSFGKQTRSLTSTDAIQRRKRKNERLILVMDEAQKLEKSAKDQSSDRREDAKDLLESIHNGELNKRVMLLAAGLGTTMEAFASLGVSRFGEGASVELGTLSKESERAVIYDWLTKKGGTKEDPTAWIDAIARETQGWPRHVHSYAKHAGEFLENSNGVMTPQGLQAVLELGQEGRKQYYKQRIDGIRGNELICLYQPISNLESGSPFNEDLILDPLNKKYGFERAEKIFKKFIDKGILSPVGTMYCVPIPSMHDWMKSELERT